MKAVLVTGLVSISTYLYVGGIPKLTTQIPLNLARFSFARKDNGNSDQVFLEYLWDLKSEISTGAVISSSNLEMPKHTLANQLQLVTELSLETGSPVTPAVNRLIKQINNEIELKQEINSELASTKATIVILAALPIIGLLLSSLLSTNSMNWLFFSPGGRGCLFIGILFNLLGVYWVKRIIRRSLQP